MMHSHPNCRCTMVPELRDPLLPTAPSETGAEWFARQDAATQRAILGPGKYDLYVAGKIGLDDLAHKWDDRTWGPQVAEVPLSRLTRRRRRTLRPAAQPSVSPSLVEQPPTRPPLSLVALPDELEYQETIADATAISRQLGVESVDYGGDLAAANFTNEALLALAKAEKPIPREIVVVRGVGQNAAVYNPNLDRIEIDVDSDFWKNPIFSTSEMNRSGYLVAEHPRDIMIHEAGHAAHYQRNPQMFRVATNFDELVGDEARVARQVSEYATVNRFEFVAEVYTGRLMGKRFSPEVNMLYLNFGGPS